MSKMTIRRHALVRVLFAALAVPLAATACIPVRGFAQEARSPPPLPVVTQTSTDHKAADRVAFCDVVGRPTAFTGRQISFVASLASDGIHSAVLMDPSCKHGMNFDSSHAASAWKPVEDALFTGGPGTSDKTITARWTGMLDLSGEVRGESPSLIIDSISELRVTPTEENSAK
jgi:FlaG/FlaF family flagellin (archaellin)